MPDTYSMELRIAKIALRNITNDWREYMGQPDPEQITKIINIVPETKSMVPIIAAGIAAAGAVFAAWLGLRKKK